MDSFISRSEAETRAFGEDLGRQARPGWVFGLVGDLGTGKTQLVKGIARGLGIQAPILSPTFALVNEYREGRWPLFHLDLYRLDDTSQIVAAGLESYFFPRDGVSVIEWFERWDGPPPPRLVRLHLRGTTDDIRVIDYERAGA